MKAKLLPLLFLGLSQLAYAHFGTLIPNTDVVSEPKEANLSFEIAFLHPMEQEGMNMEKPKQFGVVFQDEKIDLTDSLKPKRVLDKKAWESAFKAKKPGVYQYFVVPQPYWEPAEDKFILHYPKAYVSVFGEEEGWDKAVGLPVEIIPYARPFGNYTGNIFSGMVLKDGKPQPGVEVEVEYLNKDQKYSPANTLAVTQVVKTDPNGIFHFVAPWAGWWGFAALMEGSQKISFEGQPKDVEEGAVLWTRFLEPVKKE